LMCRLPEDFTKDFAIKRKCSYRILRSYKDTSTV